MLTRTWDAPSAPTFDREQGALNEPAVLNCQGPWSLPEKLAGRHPEVVGIETAMAATEQPSIGRGLDARRIHWLLTYRNRNRSADSWARGYELVRHSLETQERVFRMAEQLKARNSSGNGFPIFDVLAAADRLTSAAMSLVLQRACAQTTALPKTDNLVPDSTGYTDDRVAALNLVPAYVGYLSVNALTGQTRPWTMENENGPVAVDAVNALRAALAEAHQPDGDVLGFAEGTSSVAPVSRQPLVAFLSPGAFEGRKVGIVEGWRRGSDHAVLPIVVNDRGGQPLVSHAAGVERFTTQLRHEECDPVVLDGRDPAAFAWAIFEIECRLEAAADASRCLCHPYTIPVSCAVAGGSRARDP